MTTRAEYITAVDCLDGPSDWGVESGGPGTGRDRSQGVTDQDARPSGSPKRGGRCGARTGLIPAAARPVVAKWMRTERENLRRAGVRGEVGRMVARTILHVASYAASEASAETLHRMTARTPHESPTGSHQQENEED